MLTVGNLGKTENAKRKQIKSQMIPHPEWAQQQVFCVIPSPEHFPYIILFLHKWVHVACARF